MPLPSSRSSGTSSKAKISFNEQSKVANFTLAAIFIAQVPWLFLSVVKTDELQVRLAKYIVFCSLGIFASEQLAGFGGGWFSRTVLSGAPFNDPLRLTEDDGKTKRNTMTKFKAQFWQLVVHASMAVVECVAVHKTRTEKGADLLLQPWTNGYLLDPSQGGKEGGGDVDFMTTLYLVQMAIWVVTAFYHVFIQEKASDYLMMLGHHLVTICVIGIAFKYGFLRYGLIILLVHDVSDVPIDVLKLLNYLQVEGAKGFFLVEIAFATNLLSWIVCRLWFFPICIVWNTVFRSIHCWAASINYHGYNVDPANPAPWQGWAFSPEQNQRVMDDYKNIFEQRGEDPKFGLSFVIFGTGLLCVLCCMHVFWFLLFLRILKKIVQGVERKEIGRQEYEGDDAFESEGADEKSTTKGKGKSESSPGKKGKSKSLKDE